MRKARLVMVLVLLAVFLGALTTVGLAQQSDCKQSPVVTVMVNNYAQTTFDDELTQRVAERITAKLKGAYLTTPGDAALVKLANAGIADVPTASAQDVAAVLKKSGIDYAVYIEIDPFVRKERWSVFTHSMNMIAVVPFRVLDVRSGKYLYSGKAVEQATDTTFVLLGLGNRLTCLDALDNALDKLEPVVFAFLPLRQ